MLLAGWLSVRNMSVRLVIRELPEWQLLNYVGRHPFLADIMRWMCCVIWLTFRCRAYFSGLSLAIWLKMCVNFRIQLLVGHWKSCIGLLSKISNTLLKLKLKWNMQWSSQGFFPVFPHGEIYEEHGFDLFFMKSTLRSFSVLIWQNISTT